VAGFRRRFRIDEREQQQPLFESGNRCPSEECILMLHADLLPGWQMHQAGRAADAARCYHALLARQPDHAEALHLFGVLHHQNGYFARAVELIGRAVALRPETAAYHANLAEAYRALGRHEQAIDCCQAALRLQPDYPEAANNLGLALHALGRFAEAEAQFRAALEMRPDFALARNNLGTSLRELGQFGEALQAYRSAVELGPNLALARSNLGQMLVDQGEAEEGLAHCLEAARLQPHLPAALNNLGNAYRALERWAEAQAAYDEALRVANLVKERPGELAQVHANRGLALFLEGKHADAFGSFRVAVELAPDDGAMWQYLARAHEADEDHTAALSCWQRVVELSPTFATGLNHLGWALQQEGRFAEAGACYRRALELRPQHEDALLNQGGLHEELGEMAEAEACYRRAQRLYPRAPGPLARLALLLRGKLPEADRDAIQALLGRAGSGDRSLPARSPARGALLFGLAQVLDARGEYAGAADCLEQANALALEQRRKEGKHYHPEQHSALVDRIIAGFTPRLFDRLAGAGDDTRQPVFVFGMPRSGTTLVEQVLASHSRVRGVGELHLAPAVFTSIPEVLGQPDEMLPCLEVLDAGAVRQLSRRYRDGLEAVLRGLPADGKGSSGDRIVDKLPDNYLYLGLLALLFPRATFIHVRRDLRDVAVSCWMTHFRSIRWANDPDHLAGRCRDYARLMKHWQAALPVPVHEVVYERLVDDFEAEGRRLLATCGLEWEPACRDFHKTIRPVRTASVTQVRQPLYRRAVARWKHYETTLADLFARLPVA
jgi:tetratricopeptide (TPR) repeat protein